MACRTGCKTQDHKSYWDCLQDATIAAPVITVTGNPGAATCTTSIATAKGWSVTV